MLDPVTVRAAVLPALREWRCQAPDGTLRLLFVAAPAAIRAYFDLPEPADRFDELFLRDLLERIRQVGTPGTVVALAREPGRPVTSDRRLFRALRAELATGPGRLVDFLAVGRARAWSLLDRRAA